ncbi:hypothetical protein ACQ4PT_037448 [Festuca glaucescens]
MADLTIEMNKVPPNSKRTRTTTKTLKSTTNHKGFKSTRTELVETTTSDKDSLQSFTKQRRYLRDGANRSLHCFTRTDLHYATIAPAVSIHHAELSASQPALIPCRDEPQIDPEQRKSIRQRVLGSVGEEHQGAERGATLGFNSPAPPRPPATLRLHRPPPSSLSLRPDPTVLARLLPLPQGRRPQHPPSRPCPHRQTPSSVELDSAHSSPADLLQVLKKIRKAKRGGDHITRSFGKSRRASKNESSERENERERQRRFLGDSDQGVRSGLSDRPISYLSKSVASITLYNGDTILFSCSGIAIERQGWRLTRFLTSASLVRALYGTNKDHDDLKIEVRHEGNEVYMGVMAESDLDLKFAVVNVHAFLDVQVEPFQHALQVLPHGEILVVIGRGVSGEIIAKNVEFDGDSRVFEDDEDLDCKISEAWEGGPLVSVDSKIVGMNLFLTTRRAVFLPWGTILKHLEHCWTSQQKKTGLAWSKTSKINRFGARSTGEDSNSHTKVHGDFLNQEQLDLDSMGYPKLPSSMVGAGMILVNTFEETFGDIHGFFIEWNGSTIILTSASLVRNSDDDNKIVENLRIEVLLNSQYREGKLQNYSLHYNVALVSVKDYRALRPSNALLHWDKA